jgi:aldose 1-epimerase
MSLGGKQYVLEAGSHRATVVEVGAGLQRYTVEDAEVTSSYPDDVLPPKGCGATLVPWPNRIRNGKYSFEGTDYQLALTEPTTRNAIHGLGRWARWQPVAAAPSRLTLGLDIVPQTGYPFELRAEVTYALHADFGLEVTLTAENTGSRRAPFGAGSHPYLSTRGHALADVRLTLPATEILVVDDSQVPVGERPVARTDRDFRRGRRLRSVRLDDGFTGLRTSNGRGAAEVRTPDGGAQLWFDEIFRFLQVFTYEAITPNRPGIAIEPMTCAPNAFNTGAGLIVLEPGGRWRGSWGITPLA